MSLKASSQPRKIYSLLAFALLMLGAGIVLHDWWKQDRESEADLWEIAQSFKMPEDRPSTGREALKVRFGRDLFFDPALSANGQTACSTCHQAQRAFTDGLPQARGQRKPLARNTMPLFNLSYSHWFFWDGRADSLISQVQGPLESIDEHGMDRRKVFELVEAKYRKPYEELFGKLPDIPPAIRAKFSSSPLAGALPLSPTQAAYALTSFGSPELIAAAIAAQDQSEDQAPLRFLQSQAGLVFPAIGTLRLNAAATPEEEAAIAALDQVFIAVSAAIASFELGLVSTESDFDRFLGAWTAAQGSEAAFHEGFSAQEFEGFRIFSGKGQCVNCHFGPNFSDGQFHNIGLPMFEDRLDLGRALGVVLADQDGLGCRSPLLKDYSEVSTSESCLELPYLDQESPDLVAAFKTPSLRNLHLTGPYMHDGRFSDLKQVLRHYDELPGRPALGHREETLQPLELSAEELAALEAFLNSLNSDVRDLNAHLK